MQTIDDYAWGPRGGVLSLAERWQITLRALASRLRRRRHCAAAPAPLDARALDHITAPTDAIARAAYAAADGAQPAWLMQHALRTYAWASLLALQGGLAHERSLLFAASLLHDIGLCPHAATPAEHCFAVRGARAARDIVAAAGASAAQARVVAEAISLHLDLQVSTLQGVEAHLLQAGASVDVFGWRRQEIPQAVRGAVLARHPRLGMKRELCSCMREHARAAPNTRLGLYARRFGFVELIERAPYDE